MHCRIMAMIVLSLIFLSPNLLVRYSSYKYSSIGLSGNGSYRDIIESDGYDERVADWINIVEISSHKSKIDLSEIIIVIVDTAISPYIIRRYRDNMGVLTHVFQVEKNYYGSYYVNDYTDDYYLQYPHSDYHGSMVVSEIIETLLGSNYFSYNLPSLVFIGILGENDELNRLKKALEFIWNNMNSLKPDIITMSLGYGYYDSLKGDPVVQEIDDILGNLYHSGVVILASSGNNGVDDLMYPAYSSYTISVGAIYDDKPEYKVDPGYRVGEKIDIYVDWGSNYGDSNYGTKLEVVAPGVAVEALNENSQPDIFDGTSAAAPLAAIAASYVVATYKKILCSRLATTHTGGF